MELQRINHRHEAIVNWLVSNPDRSLTECANTLGYTLAWLSQIVHSDMFQAKYQERCREVGALAVHTVKNKLTAVAMLALGRIEDKLLAEPSERFLTESSKTVLSALGYSPSAVQAPTSHLHQHLHVDASVINAARERASARFKTEAPGDEIVAELAPTAA